MLARALPLQFNKAVLKALKPIELIMVCMTYSNGWEEAANRLTEGEEPDSGYEAILIRIRQLAASNSHLNNLTAAQWEQRRNQ